MPSKPWSNAKLKNSRPDLLLALSGITVSPALTRLDMATDPANFSLKYTNSTDHSLQISLSAKDFSSLEEGWRIKFIDSNDPSAYSYSLSSWLDFTPKTLILKPQASTDVQVTIRKDSLSGGAHYASIIADVTDAPPGPADVAIKSQLASLLFVRANTGAEKEAARISAFTKIGSDKFILRFDNYGNTELVPHGLLVVKDFLNRQIASGIVNEDSLITLPESIRRYDIKVQSSPGIIALPGPHQASLTVSFGHSQPLTSSLQFFSLPSRTLTIAIFIFFIFFFFSFRKLLKNIRKLRR